MSFTSSNLLYNFITFFFLNSIRVIKLFKLMKTGVRGRSVGKSSKGSATSRQVRETLASNRHRYAAKV